MKLENTEKSFLFSQTALPDVFFVDFLSQLPGDYLKVYLYLIFLAKYKKEIKLNDLSKKLSLPLKTINEATTFLEENSLITKKEHGYIVTDLQEQTLHKLYTPNLKTTPDKVEEISKNKSRAKVIDYINNKYFQGIMGPAWYSDIDLWFKTYNFEDQVMIALFDYCFNRSALHKNYVQAVAEAWGNSKIQTWNDLDIYYQKQEKFAKIKKDIAKKLGRHNSLTQYEEAYIEKWLYEYNYDMSCIEIALKRTTLKSAPTFEYLNNVISDWHDRNLKSPQEIEMFLEQRKKQKQDEKKLHQQVAQASQVSFEQRHYDDLSFLYANLKNGGTNV